MRYSLFHYETSTSPTFYETFENIGKSHVFMCIQTNKTKNVEEKTKKKSF